MGRGGLRTRTGDVLVKAPLEPSSFPHHYFPYLNSIQLVSDESDVAVATGSLDLRTTSGMWCLQSSNSS